MTRTLFEDEWHTPVDRVHEIREPVRVIDAVYLLQLEFVLSQVQQGSSIVVKITVIRGWKDCDHWRETSVFLAQQESVQIEAVWLYFVCTDNRQ